MADVIVQTRIGTTETKKITGILLDYLNTCTYKPTGFKIVLDETGGKNACMWMGIKKAGVKTKQYIDGSYEAELPFQLYYRVVSNGDSNILIKTRDTVDNFGYWLEQQNAIGNLPNLGTKLSAFDIKQVSTASLSYKSSDGVTDYSADFSLYYEGGL